ncbi:MAG: hypothetical protein KDE56_28305 [Anaerolineales bacterium]|nr:hypothetical protein [Anaerolineales bacterium]
MEQTPVAPATPPDVLWVIANMAGTAVCFAWFGTLGTFQLNQPTALAALAVGLLWGALQWGYLRKRPLAPSPLWPLATSLGWLLCLPFLAGAASYVPTSQAAILAAVDDVITLGSVPLKLLVGYTIPVSLLVFFGILAGIPLVLPQLGVLWLKRGTRTAVQGWFGNAVWGWIIGLAAGGILLNLIVGFMSIFAGATTALPRWLAFALLGSITGSIQALLIHFALDEVATKRNSST